MKMTPEQRAFFEYGKVQGVVEDTEIEINLASPKGGMPPITFNKEFSLKEGKKLAEKKQEICLGWAIPYRKRRCVNRLHRKTRSCDPPCDLCFRNVKGGLFDCSDREGKEEYGDFWEPETGKEE